VIENFIWIKNGRKILERLKQKIGIFIGTKNIFNFFFLMHQFVLMIWSLKTQVTEV